MAENSQETDEANPQADVVAKIAQLSTSQAVEEELSTTANGLTDNEIAKRQKKYGKNEIQK